VSQKYWATDVCFVVSEKYEVANIKFLYHFLKLRENELKKHIYGGNLPKLDKQYL